MAKVSKIPGRKKVNRKGTPPPPDVVEENLKKPGASELKDLNFKVPAEFKKEFKSYAVDRDFPSMVDLLKTCFEYYKEHHRG